MKDPIIERTAPRPRKSLLRPAVMSPNFSRLRIILLLLAVLFTAPNNDEKWRGGGSPRYLTEVAAPHGLLLINYYFYLLGDQLTTT